MEGKMKRTTWVIIGLSLCIVVLAAMVGILLFQKMTETIIIKEPDPYTSSLNSYRPWYSFSLAPHNNRNPFNYKNLYLIRTFTTTETEQRGAFLYQKIPGIPNVVVVKGPIKPYRLK